MNVLQRRMFAEGDSVSSLSPSILEYAKSLGINPTGKTAADLTTEIQLTLQAQDQSDAPGAFRTYVFDYKDPMDYLATGLAATGVGVGAAAAIKSANTARKLKKIADAAKKAGEKLNPISGRKKGGVNVKGKAGFQPRNPLNPGSYNFKPTQSAAYGTGAAFGVGMLDDDSMSTTQIPDEISAELAKLSSSEQAEADKQKQVDAKKSAQEKAQAEKNEINETLKALQTKGREFDAAENARISEERKKNAFTLMQEIGSSMVETGQIDRGLAEGATKAAKRISEERLAVDLAEDELKRKLAEEDKLSDKTWGEVTERYKEAASSLGKQKNLEVIITNMESAISTGNVSGAKGFVSRLIDDVAGFSGIGDSIVGAATKAVNDGKYLEAQAIQEILQESGRTISDRDRDLIRQMMANLESLFTGKGEALDSLSKIRLNIRASMEASASEIEALNSKYRDRIPELANYDKIYSITTDQSQGYVESDDAVLNADEIGVD
tara:strand:- start:3162 stop:4643 length:1482 start_codon:yes stop_codon:yes gene_type:complete